MSEVFMGVPSDFSVIPEMMLSQKRTESFDL